MTIGAVRETVRSSGHGYLGWSPGVPIGSTKDHGPSRVHRGLKSLQTNNLDTLDYKGEQNCWC